MYTALSQQRRVYFPFYVCRTVLQGQRGILRVNSRDHAVYERVWRVLQSHDDRDADEA